MTADDSRSSLPPSQLKYSDFLVKIRALRNIGYVPGLRPGDTDIGKVLETRLGIDENNIQGPDFETYELKSKRRESGAMMTLFTRAPHPRGVNSVLRAKCGYPPRDQIDGEISGQTTLDSPAHPVASTANRSRPNDLQVVVNFERENAFGLWLEYSGDKLIVANRRGVDAYYEPDYLRRAFERKIGKRLIYVLADSRRTSGHEEFLYNEAYLASGFDFDVFIDRLKEGVVKYDIRLGHFPDGRPHDHGTGFRAFRNDLPKCFAHHERIL